MFLPLQFSSLLQFGIMWNMVFIIQGEREREQEIYWTVLYCNVISSLTFTYRYWRLPTIFFPFPFLHLNLKKKKVKINCLCIILTELHKQTEESTQLILLIWPKLPWIDSPCKTMPSTPHEKTVSHPNIHFAGTRKPP